MRRFTIEVSEEKFDRYTKEIGEVIGICAFIEAPVTVEFAEEVR